MLWLHWVTHNDLPEKEWKWLDCDPIIMIDPREGFLWFTLTQVTVIRTNSMTFMIHIIRQFCLHISFIAHVMLQAPVIRTTHLFETNTLIHFWIERQLENIQIPIFWARKKRFQGRFPVILNNFYFSNQKLYCFYFFEKPPSGGTGDQNSTLFSAWQPTWKRLQHCPQTAGFVLQLVPRVSVSTEWRELAEGRCGLEDQR